MFLTLLPFENNICTFYLKTATFLFEIAVSTPVFLRKHEGDLIAMTGAKIRYRCSSKQVDLHNQFGYYNAQLITLIKNQIEERYK